MSFKVGDLAKVIHVPPPATRLNGSVVRIIKTAADLDDTRYVELLPEYRNRYIITVFYLPTENLERYE